MSSESIDLLWDESIKELQKLVEIDRSVDDSKQVSINDAHHHIAKLYVRYSSVLSKLNKVYELTVQPQKRLDIKSTLVHVICRVINLRHQLVKWAPPNPDVLSKGGQQEHFPWEYADINQTLRDLHSVPSHLGTDTPSFYKEELLESSRDRDAFVFKLLREKYGSELPSIERKEWIGKADSPVDFSPADEENATSISKSESDPECDTDGQKEITPIEENEGIAATKIQASVRGYNDKKKANKLRHWLDTFVGMRPDDNDLDRDHLAKSLDDVHRKRKQEQSFCQEKYNQDLTRLKDVVRDEEGFRMEVDLKEERVKWITDQVVSNNAIPDSFEGFYTKDNQPPAENQEVKDAKVKDSKKYGDKKDSKGKDKASPVEIEMPSVLAPPLILDSLVESIGVYENRWQQRNVGPDRVTSQYHDEELAKDLIIRDQVKAELTTGVEEKLLANLLKIKAMEDADKKKSKSKKESKGKKSKKAGKGKKEKPLPGAKLPGMKDMNVEDMLRELVDNGLVCIPAHHVLNDLTGGHESQPPKVARLKDSDRWIPRDPNAFQLKRAIYDYCILPLGSEQVKASLQNDEHVRSILFYGPEGSGKTLMAQAIASELGALIINLSSSTIGNSFGGKEGATKLVHMAFTVAKEKNYGLVVIYLDDCHEFFMGKVKKGVTANIKADLKRFQKDLLIYKNQALSSEDRVLVVGCTNRPDLADVKLLRWKGAKGKPEKQGFFERSLYFPRVNHSDRSMLWRQCIQNKMPSQKMNTVAYEALAVLSDGYSAAEIKAIVDATLSDNRLRDLKPIVEHDFTCHLIRRKPNDEVYLNFTRQITDRDTRWKSLHAPPKAASSSKQK